MLVLGIISGGKAQAAFPGQNGQVAWSDYEIISQNNVKIPLSRMNFNGTNQEEIFSDGFWFGPRYSSDGNKMVVAGDPDGADEIEDIYTLNPDGTNLQNITDYNSADFPERESYDVAFATFHPSGTKLVYGANWGEDFDDGNGFTSVWGIYGVDTDGSNEDVIIAPSPDTCDMYPVYSPDGSKIAFYRGDNINNTSGIYTMNADGTNITELVQISATESVCEDPFGFAAPISLNGNSIVTSGLDWSPDGQHLVYATMESADDGNDGLIITAQVHKTDLVGNDQVVKEQISLLPDEGTVEGDFSIKFWMNAQYTPEGEIIFKQLDQTVTYELNNSDPTDASITVSIMAMNSDGTDLHSIVSRPEARMSVVGAEALYESYRYLIPSVQPITSETLDWGLNATEESESEDESLANTGQNRSTLLFISVTTVAITSLLIIKQRSLKF